MHYAKYLLLACEWRYTFAEVFCQALRYKIESEITVNTIHIMFFDTPHGGFDGLDLTEDAKQQFGGWSQSLSELDREFAEIGSKFPITTFYASCPENDKRAKTWVRYFLLVLRKAYD